ncbi:MAG: metallophosphoesterase family protein [Eubacteriales bacterium]
MKRARSVIISVFLVLSLVFVMASPAYAAFPVKGDLQFNADGKFTIVQFADCQDDIIPRQAMIQMMGKALDSAKPDLVIFTGDNITGSGNPGKILTNAAIKAVLAPVVTRGIPFAIVFGNHDGESGVSKEDQLKMYQKIKGCLAYDAVPSLYGCANYNLPILSSDGSKDAFNLWLFDSNEYDAVKGGYDWVHDDQVQWYKTTSTALALKNGGLVPSLAFQHICAPETYELLKQVTPGTEGSTDRFGKTWTLELNPALAQGHLGEWPCPSDTVSGQFQAFVDRGDVLGLVSGHDHVNDFVGTYKGVDIIQSPGAGFQTYNDRAVLGCRVIVLDENNSWHYQTETPSFSDYFGTGTNADFIYSFTGSEYAALLPWVSQAVLLFLNFLPNITHLFNL